MLAKDEKKTEKLDCYSGYHNYCHCFFCFYYFTSQRIILLILSFLLMWTSFLQTPLNYKTPPPELIINPPSITKRCLVLCCMCVSLQRERNCSYCDRFKSAGREKLQLLRPLQVCRMHYCTTTTDPPSIVNPPYPGPAINQGGGYL